MRTKSVTRATPAPGPQFIGYFAPIIEALKQLGGSARPAEVRERVVKNLGVSKEMQTEVTSNGRARFDNRVAWARFTWPKRASSMPPGEGFGLSPRRGVPSRL